MGKLVNNAFLFGVYADVQESIIRFVRNYESFRVEKLRNHGAAQFGKGLNCAKQSEYKVDLITEELITQI